MHFPKLLDALSRLVRLHGTWKCKATGASKMCFGMRWKHLLGLTYLKTCWRLGLYTDYGSKDLIDLLVGM